MKNLIHQVFFADLSHSCEFAHQCTHYYSQAYTCHHSSKYCGGYRKRKNPTGDLLSRKLKTVDRVFVLLIVACFVAVYVWTGNFVLTVIGSVGVAVVFFFVAAPLLIKRLGNRYGGH